MEEIVRIATTVVLRDGYHGPTLLANGTEGNVGIMLKDFPGEHEQKVKCMFLAGNQVAKQHHIGNLNKAFFVSEAWMGTNMAIRPSKDPKRREVLLITCLDVLKNKQTLQMLEYVRDGKGNLTELKQAPLPEQVDRVESPLLPAFVAGYTGTR